MKSLPLAAALLFPGTLLFAQPAVTVYNQNFAVVRDAVPLDLKPGINEVRFAGATALLEPDSVILRDPEGKTPLQIVEQNYRNDPITQSRLLALYEGETIDFQTVTPAGEKRLVSGKIVRSGFTPGGETTAPIIEVEGKLQFSLPGEPLFPTLASDTILKPSLNWRIETSESAKLDAELAYLTRGMSWEASYNLVAPEKGNRLNLVGWVTIRNQSGKTFEEARIKLMAGDVSKIEQEVTVEASYAIQPSAPAAPVVTEKSFDEYHLYTLERPSTLRDGETKQIEFIRATGIESQRVYVYEGLQIDWNHWNGTPVEYRRRDESFGNQSDTKVAVMREFKNSKENRLGLPLPKGRVRFYQQDGDRQLEFIGENEIDHTPKNETLRIFTGNAFDLVAQRTRTGFKIDTSRSEAEESVEIKLRNRKKEAVEIRVVEPLFRETNWEITAKSAPFVKTAAQKIEFRVPLEPDEEKSLTYTVRYTW